MFWMPPLGTRKPEPEPEPEPEQEDILELEAVRVWRFLQAFNAGLTDVESALFADSDADVGLLRKLVEKGCPPERIRDIIL